MSLFSARSFNSSKIVDPSKVYIEGEITGSFVAGRIEMTFVNDTYEIDDYEVYIGKNENSRICLHNFQIKVDENPFVLKILEVNDDKNIIQKEILKKGNAIFGIGDDSYASIMIPNILQDQTISISVEFEISVTITMNSNILILFPLTFPGVENDEVLQCSDFTFLLNFPSFSLKENSIGSNPEGEIDLSKKTYLINKLDPSLTSVAISIDTNPPTFSKETNQIITEEQVSNPSNFVTCCGNYGLFTFIPAKEEEIDHSGEDFIFIVDCSGSMRGTEIELASQCLLFFIKSLPENCFFNIVRFGSFYFPLFNKPVPYNETNLEKALEFAYKLKADLYGTVLSKPLEYVFSTPISTKDKLRRVFILIDGCVNDRDEVIKLVSNNSKTTMCNAIGIGYGVDKKLVKGIGQNGNGFVDFVLSGDDMRSIVISQLSKSLNGLCKINISFENNESVEILPPLNYCQFSPGIPTTFYFKSNKKIEEKTRIMVEVEGNSEPTIIEANPLPSTSIAEKSLEYLFNNENIKFLRSLEQTKEIVSKITQLSIEYGILSPYTELIGTQEYLSPEEKERIKKLMEGFITIDIKKLTGEKKTISVKSCAKIEDVKYVIQNFENIPNNELKLVFSGKQLEDGNKLSDYSITDKSWVYLILKNSGPTKYDYAKRNFAPIEIDDLISIVTEQKINGSLTSIPSSMENKDKLDRIIRKVENWISDKDVVKNKEDIIATLASLIYMKMYKKECYQMLSLIYKKGVKWLYSIDSKIEWNDTIQFISNDKETEKAEETELIYEFNEEEKTASVLGYFSLSKTVDIPRSVQNYKGDKFTVTEISKFSFKKSKILKSIHFSIDSKVKIIEKSAFAESSIEELFIPTSLLELKDGWCYKTPKLKKITISTKNPNFIYLDNKIILGKSDSNAENYNVLIFARRDIKDVKIPSFVEIINSYAFAESEIKNIEIPSGIKEIGYGAFSSCKKLKNVKVMNDSKLKEIKENIFLDSPVEKFSIPPHIIFSIE